MAVATLTAKGQVVIPVEIRTRHELTPGMQIEFVDEAGVIRLVVRRRPTSAESGRISQGGRAAALAQPAGSPGEHWFPRRAGWTYVQPLGRQTPRTTGRGP